MVVIHDHDPDDAYWSGRGDRPPQEVIDAARKRADDNIEALRTLYAEFEEFAEADDYDASDLYRPGSECGRWHDRVKKAQDREAGLASQMDVVAFGHLVEAAMATHDWCSVPSAGLRRRVELEHFMEHRLMPGRHLRLLLSNHARFEVLPAFRRYTDAKRDFWLDELDEGPVVAAATQKPEVTELWRSDRNGNVWVRFFHEGRDMVWGFASADPAEEFVRSL